MSGEDINCGRSASPQVTAAGRPGGGQLRSIATRRLAEPKRVERRVENPDGRLAGITIRWSIPRSIGTGRTTMIANIVTGAVAAFHLYFMYLEMVVWDTPGGHVKFELEPGFATASKALAANQGLYNGFLAAGLIWGLASGQFSVKLFFLVCVIIAGIYGAFTARRSILYIQAMPALLGLILLYLSR